MDTTGSMGPHIHSVRSAVYNEIINNPKIQELSPLYILTSFNDPHSRLEIVTYDALEFEYAVNSLRASGGYDCPEMAGAGIMLALEHSLPGGKVYVFSDASAKDQERWSLAQSRAQLQKVQLNFALTGSCEDYYDDDYGVTRNLQGGSGYAIDPVSKCVFISFDLSHNIMYQSYSVTFPR